MQAQVLVIDIGSTRLKAALYSQSGVQTAGWSGDSPLQDSRVLAADVLQAVVDAALRSCAGILPDALAITGATRSHVLTDANGIALGEVVKLHDARGAQFEEIVRAAYEEPNGRGMGAFHPLARLLEAKQSQPALYAQTSWQLELKDWLNLQLTGVAATEHVAHARLKPNGLEFSDVLNRLNINPTMLPVPMSPASVIGRLDPTSPIAAAGIAHWVGLPVVQCGFDAWCASYGMGCVADRHVYNVSGTTEVFGSFSTEDLKVPGVSSLRWAPSLYHLGGPCMTGLSTLAWFGRTFLGDSDPQGVMDCAALAEDRGIGNPLCLPFVSGERMPFWRADLSAQFMGVRHEHGIPEMARALVDGLMAFQHYLVGMLCPNAETVHLSGGATGLQGWSQMKASTFARPVAQCLVAEPSLLGAAMSALTALGYFGSMDDAQSALAPAYQVIQPDPAASQRIALAAERLLPHFQQLANTS